MSSSAVHLAKIAGGAAARWWSNMLEMVLGLFKPKNVHLGLEDHLMISYGETQWQHPDSLDLLPGHMMWIQEMFGDMEGHGSDLEDTPCTTSYAYLA